MPRKTHDDFSKRYLAYLLDLFGQAEVSAEIFQNLQVDVMFTPTAPLADMQPLGLLGQLITGQALLEHFWEPPRQTDLRDCQLKLFWQCKILYNQACGQKQRLSEAQLPRLWLLSTSASKKLLESCRALPHDSYGEGVYFLADMTRSAIIALNQLPITPDTLWLRLLGRGKTREQAVTELQALPRHHPYRAHLLKLFHDYRRQLQAKSSLNTTEQELFMQLSPAYYEWERETLEKGRQEGLQEGQQKGRQEGLQEGLQEGQQKGLQKGRQEGLQEGQRLLVNSLLTTRFGTIDKDLSGIINKLVELSADQLSRFLLQASREELLAKFGKPNS
jgi:hypothetical protein